MSSSRSVAGRRPGKFYTQRTRSSPGNKTFPRSLQFKGLQEAIPSAIPDLKRRSPPIPGPRGRRRKAVTSVASCCRPGGEGRRPRGSPVPNAGHKGHLPGLPRLPNCEYPLQRAEAYRTKLPLAGDRGPPSPPDRGLLPRPRLPAPPGPARPRPSPTCGRRSKMPAAWMSSQPVTRSSVSVSGSRPLLMEGVKRSVCSGSRQFSRVISTPEYSRSPISTAPGPGTGAPLPTGTDPAAVVPPAWGPAGPLPPTAITAAALPDPAAILWWWCRRLAWLSSPSFPTGRRPAPPSSTSPRRLLAERDEAAIVDWPDRRKRCDALPPHPQAEGSGVTHRLGIWTRPEGAGLPARATALRRDGAARAWQRGAASSEIPPGRGKSHHSDGSSSSSYQKNTFINNRTRPHAVYVISIRTPTGLTDHRFALAPSSFWNPPERILFHSYERSSCQWATLQYTVLFITRICRLF